MKYALVAALVAAALVAQTKSPTKAKTPPPKAPPKAAPKMNLLQPSTVTGRAPDVFMARIETTKGPIVVRVDRTWAPNGADRFYNLVQSGYFDNAYFFRVLDFMAQVGLSSDPKVNAAWLNADIPDDPVRHTNARGVVTFASSGRPGSRSTQIFFVKTESSRLDPLGFAPFGEVVEGLDVVDMLYGGYYESPDQASITVQGEAYLSRYFPRLDKIVKATIVNR